MSGRAIVKAIGARWHAARHSAVRFPGVVICCYHGVRLPGVTVADVPFGQLHVALDEFEAHCAVFRDYCHPLTPDDLLRARHRDELPDRPVVLTFDDVPASVPRVAGPVLARYGLMALALVCDGPVRTRRAFWFDAVARRDGEAAVQRLKEAAYDAWRPEAEQAPPVADDDPTAPPSSAEVAEMVRSGCFEVGGHTTWHPILARAPLDAQDLEVRGNRDALAALTGGAPRVFAYPNGEPDRDFTDESVAVVRGAGYAAAFTTASGYAYPEGDRHQWPRFLILAGVSHAELMHRLFFRWPRSHAA